MDVQTTITRQTAAAEILSRRKVRRSLRGFIDEFSWEPPPARHHQLLIDKLEEIISGDLKRLAIFMPPGSAKSYYASIMTPAYARGRQQNWNIIQASHTQQLADFWGRRVRNLVAEPRWSAAFGVGLASDRTAVDRWELENGAEYVAAGVGGPITGKRADLFIIDDPVKSHEEAESEVYRERNWEWFRSDVRTRMKPGCRIVLIQTRWHFDDLAGRILPENYDFRSGWVTARDGEPWYVLCLPALADRPDDPLGRRIGESIWPEWLSQAMLEQERISQGPRNWASLYQQRPTPDEGGYFQRKEFQYYDTEPPHLRIYGASDYAVSEKHGDWTVHLVVGVDPADNIYVLEVLREQKKTIDWIEDLLTLADTYRDRLHVWAEEKDQIERSVGPFINKRQEERGIYFSRIQYATGGDKELKARSIQARMQHHKVFFPRNALWLAPLESELLQFPAGLHDDQVDALGLIGRMLDKMSRGVEPKKSEPTRALGVNIGQPQEIPFGTQTINLGVTLDDLWAERERQLRRD